MAHRVGSTRRDSVVNSLEEKTKQKEKTVQLETDKTRHKSEKDRTPGQFEKEFSKFKTEFKEMFAQFDAKIDKKITKLDEKFTGVFEELKRDIRSVRMEVSDTKEEVQELKTKVNELESSVTFQTERQDGITELQNSKLSKVKSDMEEMRRQLMMLEKQERKYNLLFYGFTEEREEDLESKMKQFFRDKLEVSSEKVANMQFVNCHRTTYEGEGPRPIIVRFQSFNDRELIYSEFLKPVLREERKRILTDLPVEMKIRRAKLAKEAYNIRKNEQLKTRIVEKGISVFLEVRRSKNEVWKRRDMY